MIQHHELPISQMNLREKTPSEESTRNIQCKKREKKQRKEKSALCNSHTGRGREEERIERIEQKSRRKGGGEGLRGGWREAEEVLR